MSSGEAISAAVIALEIEVLERDESRLKALIADRVRDLIHYDFNKLVNLLYRMDISEIKLRKLLDEYPESDAGVIISDLIIERQEQKIRSRKENSKPPNAGADELW